MSNAARLEFERAVLPHVPELRRFALRLVRTVSGAEDLVQEALTRAWIYWDRFEKGSNARAWMRRIVFNSFINHYRRRRREQRLLEDFRRQPMDWDQGEWLGPPVGDEHALGDEVRHALDRLPRPFQQVVIAVDLRGLSYDEAASRIGCPTGTIMSRLHRARAALRASLREYAELQGVLPTGAAA